MGYVTQSGLNLYLSDPNSDAETYLVIAKGRFTELGWSPDGRYFNARRADGQWFVFVIERLRALRVFEAAASSLEWISNDQLLYVPEQGGLVLVYMGNVPTRVILAG
jgi:hypothetical protein